MKSIMPQEPDRCFLCGAYLAYREEHHIFGGKNRKLSEKHGLKVYLCAYCHRDNREGVHGNAQVMKSLQEAGQREFEKTHTREEFMKIFGKNYLEEEKHEGAPVKTGPSGFFWIEEGEGNEQSNIDGPFNT